MKFKMHSGRGSAAMVAAGMLALAATAMGQVAPADIWPAQAPSPAGSETLGVRLGELQAALGTMSPELRPAIKFEEVFLHVMAAEAIPEWLPPMQAFATATADDPVSTGVREVSKAWVARAEMDRIATVLDQFYGENVRFPASWAEVEKRLPAELKTDPWGETWVYRTHAPKGFANEGLQRYELGPKRYPNLGTLRDAVGGRQPFTPPAWKVALQVTGSNRALEFRQDGAIKGLITAGGKVGDYSLLYVGDRWALMAATDQLFTISF